MFTLKRTAAFALFVTAFAGLSAGQETPPVPGPPKSGQIPVVREKKLANRMTVAVAERHSIPLVTVQLLVKSGASDEDLSRAGLADLLIM